MRKLEKNEIYVLRTDLRGTITVKSDGINELRVTTDRDDSESFKDESSGTPMDGDSSDRSEETSVESEGEISDESTDNENVESIAA